VVKVDGGMSAKGRRAAWSDLMWQVVMEQAVQDLECLKKEAVGEAYEGKPHVRFEVAGDGNRDRVWVIEALPEETGSKQAAQPKF
jgi:hypothetical protein